MIFYQITFGPYTKDNYREAEDLLHGYLASLCHNGQITYDYDLVPWQGNVLAYVTSLGIDASLLKSHSIWGKDELKKVKKFFGQSPSWAINEDDPLTKKTNWKNAPFLFLSTSFSDWHSPLCRGDDGLYIAIYRVPITDMEREHLYSWQSTHRELDNIWIRSGELEMQAYKALADPQSEHSSSGRKFCGIIEKATGVPTYYYLDRYFGRKEDAEKKRLCPCCAKPWFREREPNAPNEPKWFHEFDFLCETCRLVSRLGVEINNRYAKIGEPKLK